jgi:hypothetical protein
MVDRARRDMSHLPRRLMPLDEAAHYCGVSAPTFEAYCPVPPRLGLFGRRKLWDRVELDRWLDGMAASHGETMASRLEKIG